MITIEEGLQAFLSGVPGVAALVTTRIYPIKLPQGTTLPAITYQRVSGLRERSHSGSSGLAHPRFQVDCWGRSYGAARGLANQVRQALDGYRGAFGGGGTAVPVGAAMLENDQDLYDEETEIYHIALDFVIWHDEDIA